ncbi:MAG: glycosyltransferase family 39 protein [Planctomycetota bacterium]|nr:glycosyltransferase family 39 protein [Planctomycetota bacterium]
MRALFKPGLATAIAVYALLRALLLYTAFDETVMPQYELYPMGTIPKILSGAGHIPIQFHYDNAAGQLFTGVVAWPIYALIGESYLALKLVPALLGVGGLIFLHLFLRENFSARAANIGALFFALGPVPTMMKYSVFAGGNHFEHIPFAIFTLWCFYRLHREHGGGDRRWLFITGVAMGFQLFILLGAAIPIALLGFMHLGLRGVRSALRDLSSLIPGALIGASPLIAINWATGGRSGEFVGANLPKDGPSFFDRASEFAWERLGRAATFDDFFGMPAALAATLFLCVTAVVWFASLPGAMRGVRALALGVFSSGAKTANFDSARIVPLALYFPAIVVVYAVTTFKLYDLAPPMQAEGYRYYLPHFLFILCLFAVTVDRWLSLGGLKRAAGRALLCGGFFAASFNLTYIDFGFTHTGAGAHYAGYNYVQTARALFKPTNIPVIGKYPGKWSEWEPDREEIVSTIETFGSPWREQLYIGAGWCEAQKQYMANAAETAKGAPFLDTREFLSAYPEDVRGLVARGAGLTVRIFWRENSQRWTLAEWLTLQTPRADPAIAEVIAGANIPHEFPHAQSEFGALFQRALSTLVELDPQRAEQFARGLGHLSGVVLERGIPGEVAELEERFRSVRMEHRNAILRGVGEQLSIASEAPYIPDAARRLEAPEGAHVLEESFERNVRRVWGEEAE